MKTYIYAKTRIQMFIVSLFIIAKNWKKAKMFHHLVNGETKYSISLQRKYSTLKMIELYEHSAAWMNPINIKLNERNQTEAYSL
jgi:hypothetical protein